MRTVALLVCLLALGCASTKVAVDYDRERDFAALKRFAWLDEPVDGMRLYRNIRTDNLGNIQRLIENELTRKGLARDDDEPDVYLHVYADAGGSVSTQQSGDDYQFGMGGSGNQTTARAYLKGALVVEIYAAGDKGKIWEAAAETTVEESEHKIREKVIKALTRMFVNFPPT